MFFQICQYAYSVWCRPLILVGDEFQLGTFVHHVHQPSIIACRYSLIRWKYQPSQKLLISLTTLLISSLMITWANWTLWKAHFDALWWCGRQHPELFGHSLGGLVIQFRHPFSHARGVRTFLCVPSSFEQPCVIISLRNVDFVSFSKTGVLLSFYGVRLFLALNPFKADRLFPSCVFGPVLNPPWYLHRPFSKYILFNLHGVPARVFAPHVIPTHSSGKDGYFVLFSSALLKALQNSLRIFLNSGVLIIYLLPSYFKSQFSLTHFYEFSIVSIIRPNCTNIYLFLAQ